MTEWISVEDRLPEVGVDVLCLSGKEFFVECISESDEDEFVRGVSLGQFKRFFTHWMPLPEPPESEE